MQAGLPADVIFPLPAQLWLVLGPPLLGVMAECMMPHAVALDAGTRVAAVARQAIAHADLKRIADVRLTEP
jgi:hypothetical protein